MHAVTATFARAAALVFIAVALAGCASRPVNSRLEAADPTAGYRSGGRTVRGAATDTLIILAFSGGGTRAASFSFGVLEELRGTSIVVNGQPTRMLDEVDVVTGISGGSFTALAYALYGEKLFDEYEQRFLKRNVQGELISRFLNPVHWPSLASEGWGRSEMAAEYYDEILFEGATFGDLVDKPGPVSIASATDISTGARFAFVQGNWDIICSDLSKFPLSRAAAASSAVPVALSPVTINNYGGTCGYQEPASVKAFRDPASRSRPAGRTMQRYKELQAMQNSVDRPYFHLVDGGISDNLGMRAVLEGLEQLEASDRFRRASRIGSVRRIVVFVVNSMSVPKTDWDKSERPPNDLQLLLKATGVPIDLYSYEAVELLRDTLARWKSLRALKAAAESSGGGNSQLVLAAEVPDIELYAIDASFAAHPDPAEREYLNAMPTSFVLSAEQVDRLRAAAGVIVRESPEYQRLLRDLSLERLPPSVPEVPPILR